MRVGSEISDTKTCTGSTKIVSNSVMISPPRRSGCEDDRCCAAAARARASRVRDSSSRRRESVWKVVTAVRFSYRRTARLRASISGWTLLRNSAVAWVMMGSCWGSGCLGERGWSIEDGGGCRAAASATCASSSSNRVVRSESLLLLALSSVSVGEDATTRWR